MIDAFKLGEFKLSNGHKSDSSKGAISGGCEQTL